METKTDPEDNIDCECFIIFGYSKDGRFFPDRVYGNLDLAKKRLEHLNSVSNGHGEWFCVYSEFVK